MKGLFWIITLLCFSQNAFARDLGVNGHTYEIVEQHFLKMIEERAKKVDWNAEKTKIEKIAKERVKTPPILEHILPAKTTKEFYFDPTYVLDSDAVLPSGEILHKAGTKVNPLEHMKFDRRLIFIDSREKMQVQWLKEKIKEKKPSELFENKIILIAGSPLELEEELKENIYFDQQGALTKKFGISHSPAIVEAEGLELKITEYCIEKER